jgi:hypothetical protein
MDGLQSQLMHASELSVRLWQAAGSSGKNRPVFWPTREIEEITGLSIAPGRIIANRYAFGGAGQFVSHCREILAEAGRHLGLGCSCEEWLRANPYLQDLFWQFYGGSGPERSIPPETPALIAVIPVYVTERYVVKQKLELTVEDRVRQLGKFEEGGDRLGFGNELNYPSVHLDMRKIRLHRPPGCGAGDMSPTLRERRRGFKTRSGEELAREFTWGLSLACPDDHGRLRRGGYYPAFDSRAIRAVDARGSTTFVRVAVLKLFRLHVEGSSQYDSIINQVNISFCLESGQTMDFNTVRRPFWQAAHHYLDLESVLDERLPELPWGPRRGRSVFEGRA